MKILVLKLSTLEESILAVPLLNSLRKTFKESEINLITYEENIEILENKEIIDNIFGISKRERRGSFGYFFKSLKMLKNNYDIIIDLSSNNNSILDMLSFGAKFKIKRDDRKLFNSSNTYLIKNENGSYDEVDENLKFLEPLNEIEGIKIVYDKEIILKASQEEKQNFREKLEKEGIDFSVPVFACSLFSETEEDTLPLDDMKKIINKLALEKINIVFYYKKGSKRKTMKFIKELENNQNVYMVEIENIKDYKGFFANCGFFFGTECEERYIAQGIGVPSFIIFENQDNWISNYGEKFRGIVSNKINKEYFGVTKDRIFGKICYEKIYENIMKMLKENKVIK